MRTVAAITSDRNHECQECDLQLIRILTARDVQSTLAVTRRQAICHVVPMLPAAVSSLAEATDAKTTFDDDSIGLTGYCWGSVSGALLR